MLKSVSYNYVFGVQELGDKVEINTIFDADLASAQEETGEGIPAGWRRVMTNSSGGTEVLNGVAANCAGVRLKYFDNGGDFDAGFYLSARDQSKCNLYYGMLATHRMYLEPGDYTVSFDATYWSQGAADGRASFSFSVCNTSMTSVFSAPSLNPTGCLMENSAQKVSGAKTFEYNFTITRAGNYVLNFEMSEGWNSVVIGDVKVTSQLTLAEKYKGGFMEAMRYATEVAKDYGATETDNLSVVIAKYEAFSSVSPSEFTAATQELTKAADSFKRNHVPLAIEDVKTSRPSSGAYDIRGRKVSSLSSYHGLYVEGGKVVIRL